MKITRLIGALLVALSTSHALAETKPTSLPSDPRIRQFTFDPNTVYRLDVFMKFITSVHFADGEQIESIQIGDSASWEVVRLSRGDVLSVKPLIMNASTNMTVLTDRRDYTFELRAKVAAVGSPKLNYRISFTYPQEQAERLARQFEIANRPKDFNYLAAGETSLRPTLVFDDGVSTHFHWPDDLRRPAVFRVNAEGKESIVNMRSTPDGFIVDSISDRWTIRDGDAELCVAHQDVIETVPLPAESIAGNPPSNPRVILGAIGDSDPALDQEIKQ